MTRDVRHSRPSRVQEVNARVMRIDYTLFEVEIVTRSDELADSDRWEQAYCTDPYYRIVTESDRREAARARAATRKKPFVPRPIKYPLFKNVSIQQATHELEGKADGSCIIRPHQKYTDRLQVRRWTLADASGRNIDYGDLYYHTLWYYKLPWITHMVICMITM